ncbi:MAG: AMP-binding protein [Desulfarculaceae bacterium]|nr:AMP-binding protein [Desulfarculaceae bacterium]MCF8071354.1 AMP-binding protein [Desulfarculaceae bacterium]MCF8101679.1 AMP-binding protein [Desulfarculaceae bacterium]MCF8116712.1 AMP-binding protein [Desulfarculaceae bacterium]
MVELSGKTLGQFFLDRVAERGEQVALREKDFGIWQKVTWEGYRDHVKHFALGLVSLGFKRGDQLAIISENCREWLYADLAAICLGGVSVGVYPTSPYPEVHYVVKHSDSRFVVAEDQEQTDKILEVWDDLPLVEKIIVKDTKGLRHYPQDIIMSFEAVEELGRAWEAKEPDRFEKEVALGKAEDVCIMVYTSGTTGKPKGAMINHLNIEAMTLGTIEAIGATDQDSVVSYLPLCHVAEKIFSLFLPMYVGYPVNFAESIATIQSDLREIAPTVFLGVPRIWEKLQSAIYINIQDSSRLKRWLFRRSYAVGRKMAGVRLEGRPAGPGLKLGFWAAYWLMLRSLQNFVGLRSVRFCFSAAAKVSPDVLRFFHDLGIRVKEGYGMTESTGLSFIHMDDDIRMGTVGKPISCVEFAIAPDGELLKKGPLIFVGYYKNDQATREAIVDGWLHTGDVAEMDERGHLCIVDRKKDIIITSGGKNIAPSEIENALKVSPYIKEAIVIGEGRNFIAALIQIDFDNVGKWATDNHLAYTNFKNLSVNPEVLRLIQGEVDQVNNQFARVENVRKFKLLTKELDHDDDELTATMKVRRANIYQKFAEEIEEVYGKRA